jgi:hypothetical protein
MLDLSLLFLLAGVPSPVRRHHCPGCGGWFVLCSVCLWFFRLLELDPCVGDIIYLSFRLVDSCVYLWLNNQALIIVCFHGMLVSSITQLNKKKLNK